MYIDCLIGGSQLINLPVIIDINDKIIIGVVIALYSVILINGALD
jgi:hypothetical protein